MIRLVSEDIGVISLWKMTPRTTAKLIYVRINTDYVEKQLEGLDHI